MTARHRRPFRVRVIGHMAWSLAQVVPSPLSYAGRLGDGWFPRPRSSGDALGV